MWLSLNAALEKHFYKSCKVDLYEILFNIPFLTSNLDSQAFGPAKYATWMPNKVLHASDAAIIKVSRDIRAPLKQKSLNAGLSPCD